VVRHTQAEPEQADNGAEQPLGLPVARRNTARIVSAVRMAGGEYQGWPPRVVRGSAAHALTASPVNYTVKLPRWRRLASWTGQFVTSCRCRGMW